MPLLKTVAPTIGKTLGLSASACLASEGASQIVKEFPVVNYFKYQMKIFIC